MMLSDDAFSSLFRYFFSGFMVGAVTVLGIGFLAVVLHYSFSYWREGR